MRIVDIFGGQLCGAVGATKFQQQLVSFTNLAIRRALDVGKLKFRPTTMPTKSQERHHEQRKRNAVLRNKQPIILEVGSQHDR
jgi:hypothetical protein